MSFKKHQTVTGSLFGAILPWVPAGALLIATPALAAQAGRTGVSVPQPVLADSSESQDSAAAKTKPSAAMPLPTSPTRSAPDVYGPYVPYNAKPSSPTSPTRTAAPFDPDASIATGQTAGRRLLTDDPAIALGDPAVALGDPDARIVTRVPTHPGEINDSALINARLGQTLSTLNTQPGSRFTAEVSEPVMQEGQVYIPAGSVLEGRVTWIGAGRRIGGRAAIHLEPQRVTLPDGTVYALHARVIDTSSWQNTSVDREGTIIRKDNVKGTLEAGGLATGGAMAAGAVLAGPPGALIGAGIGAGATAIVWFKQDRQATLPKDLGLIFSLTAPLSVNPSHAGLTGTAGMPRSGGE